MNLEIIATIGLVIFVFLLIQISKLKTIGKIPSEAAAAKNSPQVYIESNARNENNSTISMGLDIKDLESDSSSKLTRGEKLFDTDSMN
ncbi:MAG: hypothetical protein Q8933_04890 [Bacteroidota bacterium]|nr:hypothetical protein [Bacteroidota bacterium]MDP4191175.1 hypothetical protein [Bacteroidota bacterium]MDP4197531.1 hypothetical protein [Bacteroidota bacterium]